MGLSIGLNKEVIENLVSIGLSAATISVFSIVFSILFVRFFRRFMKPVGDAISIKNVLHSRESESIEEE